MKESLKESRGCFLVAGTVLDNWEGSFEEVVAMDGTCRAERERVCGPEG